MSREEQIIKDELQEAQYIGEDGGMCIDGKLSAEEAYKRMIKRWTEDCFCAEKNKKMLKEYYGGSAVSQLKKKTIVTIKV